MDTENAGSEWMRRRNTAAVLRSLKEQGSASRAELATRTGLAKATIGTIVAQLEAAGAVVEEATREGMRGRPARPMRLAGDHYAALGLELNVDYVAAVVLDLAGQVIHHETRRTTNAASIEALVSLARERTDALLTEGRHLLGTVVALPGLVSGDNRTVSWAPNITIDGDEVARAVEAVVPDSCLVEIRNDADCAALGEAHHGAARDASSLLYVTGTVGIGGGIVDNGALVRGEHGFAGEVGHIPLGDPDSVCGCGRHGCWEASIGLLAMLRAAGCDESGTPIESAEAVAVRAEDDERVREALDLLGENIGAGLAVLTPPLDPAVVVLGGYFTALGDLVLEPARRRLQARLLASDPVPELRVGELGIEAAALGAAERAFADLFEGSVSLPE